ncbi:DegT/DnrJ/EryC1/StrS family aminotransferase [Candidatus Vallotia tarda]|uniref:UDP-4-amino-4-deoxy-L-arabinose--oxoglutarate aminotransferase n=1 Tax=Candidatus Vallotiella hemipterorum TaxID=1177213 RepID=A0A916NLT2_9BURK|nr:DegT/DnrJ/EryC1/StrS aminotransferase family protein [Candidatus Vallotia tarda]CAG7602511.1 UDP-4-amino-4-deoxy-L-arabinose--oxoglutarate aminotransferase [Candidatus Vallotia tarda]
MSTTSLPFLPFVRPYVDEETIAGVINVLRSGWITTGPQNARFEAALSEYCGHRPVRAFNSGTCTIEIALRIAGIGPGDEVITTPLSWVSSSNMICEVGATPVFVDINPVTRNLDLDKLESAITSRSRAIIPVYLAGMPMDLDRLYALARTYQLRLIEDAAQALGSSWNGQRVGERGDFVSFSFHANKNITSIEGGALIMNHDHEAQLAQKYRLQGITRTGFDGMECDLLGGKYNLTDVAARVGLGSLARLDEITAQRRKLARAYFTYFSGGAAIAGGIELPPKDFINSNWHMFQIVLPLERIRIKRANFMAQMKERGIGTGVHYLPIHLFKLYQERGFKLGMFPHAERIGRAIVTLPLFPQMTIDDVSRVVQAVNEIIHHHQQ